MQKIPPHDKSKKATPKVPAIAFITAEIEELEQAPLWVGHDLISYLKFIDDMDALGFALLETPAVTYVFVGVQK